MDVSAEMGAQSGVSRLRQLRELGQSPWLDFIRRGFVADGSLRKLVDEDGLGGVTSNPSIFEKAMAGSEYDAEFRNLAPRAGYDANRIYETLAVADIRAAAEVLRPVYERTQGADGYVSLEVSPYLALRKEDTVAEARRLWAWVDRPNLMVKVPGTAEGVPAIRALIEDGININVTLLFSLSAYREVWDAYCAGLEARKARGLAVGGIASVASFFVSRIDAVIDKKIDARVAADDAEAAALAQVRGQVAIANARAAYGEYLGAMAGDRWRALARAGAQPQRLLWASTGTKDSAYRDVRYVEELIGPDTVNTIPPATMDAFRDHGEVRASLTEGLDQARAVLAEAERLGLDLAGVTQKLVEDGVRLFADAADQLLGAVAGKRASLLDTTIAGVSASLPAALETAVAQAREAWRAGGMIRRVWARDASVWTGGAEGKWLGWLDVVAERAAGLGELQAFAEDVRKTGFEHVLLLGMGGSSLGPEVLGRSFGHRAGWPVLHVLDSTDPQQVASFRDRVDLARTLVIVASKSGGTLEPHILQAYFFEAMRQAVGDDRAGSHFVAITDPGSKLEGSARAHEFRYVFLGNPEIGGRYSVLSNFGLVPAAAIGIDVASFLTATARMVTSCSPGTPPSANPGVLLGTVLGAAGRAGHDKVTIVASPGIASLGAWLEQLIAESTGKNGVALIPIEGETLAPPHAYGADRLFVYVQEADAPDAAQDAAVWALEQAGQPVVRVTLNSHAEIGQQFFLWEMATAVAGSLLGIDPFDQPDVEASKLKTRALTEAYSAGGQLPEERPFAEFDGIALYADAANARALDGDSLEAVLRAHFARVRAGDYVGLLAYVEQNQAHAAMLQEMRLRLRDSLHVATAAEFGPRFLHSTGQAYKGGPNSGVFLQITAADARDLDVPGERFSFGVVKAAQARGDFDVLSERGRRALRVHLGRDVPVGLRQLGLAIQKARGSAPTR